MRKEFEDQRNISSRKGDCLRTCVSNLLDIPYEKVSDFNVEGWRKVLANFLFYEGYTLICIPFHDFFLNNNQQMEFTCILSVDSFHYKNSRHAVLGQLAGDRFAILHDPNPKNKNRKGTEYKIREVFLVTKKLDNELVRGVAIIK